LVVAVLEVHQAMAVQVLVVLLIIHHIVVVMVGMVGLVEVVGVPSKVPGAQTAQEVLIAQGVPRAH
jgi:hypothetical protein